MSKLNRKISGSIISCVLIVCNSIHVFAAESLEYEAFSTLARTYECGVV